MKKLSISFIGMIALLSSCMTYAGTALAGYGSVTFTMNFFNQLTNRYQGKGVSDLPLSTHMVMTCTIAKSKFLPLGYSVRLVIPYTEGTVGAGGSNTGTMVLTKDHKSQTINFTTSSSQSNGFYINDYNSIISSNRKTDVNVQCDWNPVS